MGPVPYPKYPVMKKSSIPKISIYLKIDSNSINNYFNPHDPARLDRRQLGQEFKNYLDTAVANAGRHTTIDFKVFCCETGSMRFMVDPLMRTIRRHFQIQKPLAAIHLAPCSMLGRAAPARLQFQLRLLNVDQRLKMSDREGRR